MERKRQEEEDERQHRQMEEEIDVDDSFNSLFMNTQTMLIIGGCLMVIGFTLAICCIRACNSTKSSGRGPQK